MADGHGNVKVLITSVDGNVTHPFKSDDTVSSVHAFAYEKLVQDQGQVPFATTSMEFGGQPVADSEKLGVLATRGEKRHGHDVDLVLALVWTSQGGSSRFDLT